jgi:hypothetical protein
MKNELKVKCCFACKVEKSFDCFGDRTRAKDGKNYQCKECDKKFRQTEHYKTYRAKYNISEKRKKYNREREKTPNRLQYHRDYKKKIDVKIKTRIKQKQQKINLNFSYVKKALKKKGFTNQDITNIPELIEVQKEIIKIKRLCKI